MLHAINDYRRENGKQVIVVWDGMESHHCKEHCWAMSKVGGIYHAPECFLKDWKEVVYECQYCGEDIHQLAKRIMFESLNSSPEHRDIVLNSQDLAVAYVIHNWKLYLTIRGK